MRGEHDASDMRYSGRNSGSYYIFPGRFPGLDGRGVHANKKYYLNRLFLENGKVLFQYHCLDLDLAQDNLPKDRRNFFLQLLYMLYQLRNNIVHGGSAAFFMQKTDLTVGALRLLDALVQYLFHHSELLQQDCA